MNASIFGKHRVITTILIALLCSIAFELVFREIDRRVYDVVLAFRVSVVSDASISDDVAIVLVDAESESRLGSLAGTQLRAHIPELLDLLKSAGARTVVLDFIFDQRDEKYDESFRRAISDFALVVAATSSDNPVQPNLKDAFAKTGSYTAIAVNGVPRIISGDETIAEATSISVLAIRQEGFDISLPQRIWINYAHPLEYFTTFGLADITLSDGTRLADRESTPASILRGKTVFVGLDYPNSDRASLPHILGRKVPGVYAHAYAYQTMLDQSWLHPTEGPLRLLMAVVITGLLACTTFLGPATRRWGVLLACIMWCIITIVAFLGTRILLPLTPVLAGVCGAVFACRFMERTAIRAELKAAIGFDPSVLDAFRKETINKETPSALRPATILCSDIRSYTRFVQSCRTADVAAVMREYLTEMERIITNTGGYVNKYIGDAIVAVFGFPLNNVGTCDRAVRAGIAMLESMKQLINQWRNAGCEHFDRIGIGIDTGEVSFLEIGASKKQFDIIGNAMNGAARIEGLTKSYNPPLLVTQEVLVELNGTTTVADVQDLTQKEVANPEDNKTISSHPDFNMLGRFPIRGQGERVVYQLNEQNASAR